MEFRSALQGTFDDQKPSLFELLAEQQLSSLLAPTLRYLLTVATQQHPRYLLRVLNSFDELYALLQLLVEHHFLTTYGGGFTENFYGLVREKAAAGSVARARMATPLALRDALALTPTDVWKNVAVMVALPYLKRKLDAAHEVDAPRALLGAAYARLPHNATLRDRFRHAGRWFLRRIYPSVSAAYGFALLALQFAYLANRTAVHSPLLWLTGSRMRRLGVPDYHAIAAVRSQTARTSGSSRLGAIAQPVLSSLRLVLPTGIFALKFLEWWHASDFARQLSSKAIGGISLPPPLVSGLPQGDSPPELSANSDISSSTALPSTESALPPISATTLRPILTVPPSNDSRLCPICEREVQTATACQTGYIFCYVCIHRWVAGEHDRQVDFMATCEGAWEIGQGRCAVTGRRVLGGTEGLRRVIA